MTCSVAGVQAGEVSSWQFSGGQANVTAPGGVTSWTGLMVQGGTVSANLNIAGNLAAPFVSVTVNPRTNFTVSMPTPGLKPNGTPPLPVLTSPPDTSEGAFGQSRYQYYFNPMTAQVPSGPNEGFTYVTALDTSLSYFIYELNPGLVTPSDPFYQHQYGNCGIPSVQQIVTAVTNHEAGASSSHWSEMAAQMAASNPGPVAEKEVGLPGTTPQALNGQASKDLTPYFAAVANAGIPEPPTNLPPNINFPPYRTCP